MQPKNFETPTVDAAKAAERPEGHNSAIVAISARELPSSSSASCCSP